jgi:hypothetical protein
MVSCIFLITLESHQTRYIEWEDKLLSNDYDGKESNVRTYSGVQYVASNEEYTDEASDDKEHEKKNDEFGLIERHLKNKVYVYTNNELGVIQIDIRCIKSTFKG